MDIFITLIIKIVINYHLLNKKLNKNIQNAVFAIKY